MLYVVVNTGPERVWIGRCTNLHTDSSTVTKKPLPGNPHLRITQAHGLLTGQTNFMATALTFAELQRCDDTGDTALLDRIADDLYRDGYCIVDNALPEPMTQALFAYQKALSEQQFSEAGIGRKSLFHKNESVRTDKVCWIDGSSQVGAQWLEWCNTLKAHLNKRLFMGLFSFESHFAHYRPGDFYKRHYDAFKGASNRVLSLVTYLNKEWDAQDGGELVLYKDDADTAGVRVTPKLGTVVLFLSEEFPHEVRPATRDRYSIAGWFRVNTTSGNRIDPPR